MKINSLNKVHFNLSLPCIIVLEWKFKQNLTQKISLSQMKITATSFQTYKIEFYSNDSSFLHSLKYTVD